MPITDRDLRIINKRFYVTADIDENMEISRTQRIQIMSPLY